MEAATTPAPAEEATAPPEAPEAAPEQDATAVETSPSEKQDLGSLFKFSTYLHIGDGADVCEDGEDGSCANPLHFHAWCRLPNQFQHDSIREKAMAAKARKGRQLRSEESDGADILEGEMDVLLRAADREALIEQVVSKNYWRDQFEAMREVKERDEFSTIEEDLERYRVLSAQSEEERSADEFEELTKHVAEFEAAVSSRREEESEPQREALSERPIDELVGLIRDDRIEQEANEEFMRSFSMWEWYIGTMKPRDPEKGLPNERVFGDVNHLAQGASPEVVAGLDAAFKELETARGQMGNS